MVDCCCCCCVVSIVVSLGGVCPSVLPIMPVVVLRLKTSLSVVAMLLLRCCCVVVVVRCRG